MALRALVAVALLAAAARADTLAGAECVVFFPPAARAKAERIGEEFLRSRDRAARWLGLEPSGMAEIRLVEGLGEMHALFPGAPAWAVAVTSGSTLAFRLDLLDKGRGNALDLVLRHEAVHFALNRTHAPFPRWFEEGLAVHHAGVAYLAPDTSLERAAAAGRLPSFGEADRLFSAGSADAALGYEMGERVVAAVVRRFGDGTVARLVRALGEGEGFPAAFARVTGVRLEDFEREWRDDVTPSAPLWLFVLAENLEITLICAAAALAALGYLRWRLRRERAMASLGVGPADAEPPPGSG